LSPVEKLGPVEELSPVEELDSVEELDPIKELGPSMQPSSRPLFHCRHLLSLPMYCFPLVEMNTNHEEKEDLEEEKEREEK
jgi:hypothetical protein